MKLAREIGARQEADLSFPFGGHKYQEAAGALRDVGFERKKSRTAAHVPQPGWFPWLFGSVLPSVPVFLRCAGSSRLRNYSELIFLFRILERQLGRSEIKSAWLIVGDLTMPLIALSAAIKKSKHLAVYWQYSLLDFKKMPVESDYAVVLNEKGPVLARLSDPERIFWRDETEIKPLKLQGVTSGPIGAFLNVHANDDSITLLVEIAERLGQTIHVRLHPNSRLAMDGWPSVLRHAPSSEPLERFSERISLAICGNTQAQIKTLASGTPVVQFAGLDILEFDHHEYVKKGIVLGFENAKNFSIDDVRNFYEDPTSRRALESFLEVPCASSYRRLSELNTILTKHS
jgi:hypothetical protein